MVHFPLFETDFDGTSSDPVARLNHAVAPLKGCCGHDAQKIGHQIYDASTLGSIV
jgi:hypothetical protein